MHNVTNNTTRLYVCAGERLKLIGAVNGFFPDMGHHLAKEMLGMWLHPIKLLDGFWMRLEDHSTDGEVNCWINADQFVNYPYGNKFLYSGGMSHTDMSVERFQFSPDDLGGCVVIYTLVNRGGEAKDITCEMLVRTDLRPVWRSEDIGLFDGSRDEAAFIDEKNLFIAKDNEHEWYAAFGSDTKPVSVKTGQFFASEITSGNGVSTSMTFEFSFGPYEEKKIVFYFAGSYISKDDCLEQYEGLYDYDKLLEKKKKRYDEIRGASELITTDKEFDEIYSWIKANTDWLVLNAPPVGRGLTAGLPEYPFWFGCDGCYAVMGLLTVGNFELARQTLKTIREASERHNSDGRVIHEVTGAGVVCNPGNTQETAHFVNTVWEYYQWTGDKGFLSECFPYMRKSMEWLRKMDDDQDFFPSGYGIIEIAGLNMEMIDTAVYTCTAYDAFSKICALFGYEEDSRQSWDMFSKTKEAILKAYWIPERGLFADAVTSSAVVSERLEKIVGKWRGESGHIREYLNAEIASRVDETQESGWLLNEAWVIITPMETGIAPAEYADTALGVMYSDRYIGPYGAYLSGMNSRSTMTISSGVFAVAQARYGYSDRALDILRRMFSTFSMATPGSLSEMSPDYGCFVQGWTIYSSVAIVKHFFGIQPDAFNSEILFEPCMPEDFDHAEIKNVAVLDGVVSVSFSSLHGRVSYDIINSTGFPVRIGTVPPGTKISINGREIL